MQWSKRKLQILIAVLAAVLISVSGVANVMAKYATKTEINGQVTITADLGQIGIWETTVTYNTTTGSFTKGVFEGQVDKTYSYPIIPGYDIPKDTIVRVDKDSNDDGTDDAIVPAYVYLIIVETNITSQEKGIQYTLESHWKPVDGYSGVYVYSDANGPVQVSSSVDIRVLVGNHIFVSQYVNQNVTSQVSLKFTATMRQVITGQTAAQIYESDAY